MNQTNEHDDVEFLLCRYLDGDLSPRERRELEQRLAAEPDLRAELDRYAALGEHLRAMGAAALTGADYDGQRGEIMAALERRHLLEAPQRRVLVLRPVFWAPALAAAAAVVLSVLAWRFFERPAQTPVNGPGPAQTLVAVNLESPEAPQGQSESVMTMTRLPDGDILLTRQDDVPAEPGPAAPPGTIMVSFTPEAPAETAMPMPGI